MIVYSTCSGCNEILQLTTEGQSSHPLCTPAELPVDALARQWMKAVIDGDLIKEAELERQINAIENQPPRLAEAALWYASWGWPVFPLVNNQKRPCTANGFKDATTDADQIREWWKKWPGSNVGLATGHLFDVIDVDVPEGVQSYIQLKEQAGLEVHGHVSTASGGVHLYVKPTGEGNRARMAPGVDYRGLGGYVVAPPSTLGPRWRSWAWISKPSPLIKKAGVPT